MRLSAVAASLALLCAFPAAAATLVHFELGGPHSASFDIRQQPLPTSYALGSSFDLAGVTGVFDGAAGIRTVRFFNNALDGGFSVVGDFVANYTQLYSGTEARPSIYTGDFLLVDPVTGATSGLIIYQSGTVGDIPEPATWMTLIAGFGLVGAGLRHRRRAVRA